MPVELYKDPYGSLQHYPEESILELRWTSCTVNMTDEDFRCWLKIYGEHAVREQTQFLVVDVCVFGGSPSAESTGSWREEHIVPLYRQAGVKKFAYLVPPQPIVSRDEDPKNKAPRDDANFGSFATSYLDSWDAIRIWFAATE